MTYPDNDPKTTARNALEDAKGAASDLTQSLRSSAQDIASKASADAADMAHRAQSGAADEVRGVAAALRTASREMRGGSPQEKLFSQMADTLADASDTMRDKEIGEIVQDVTTFARRNPMIFIGAAAMLGFAVSRFAKASSGPRPADMGTGPFGGLPPQSGPSAPPYGMTSSPMSGTSVSTPGAYSSSQTKGV